MGKEELEELLDVPAETRMDAERILFALEEKPDGFNTSVCRIAEQVLGKSLGDDFSYFFNLDTAIRFLAENHGLLLDAHHHDCKVEGLPFVLDFYVWHRKNAAANGKFNNESSAENHDYRYEHDEFVSQAISEILEKALPAFAIPTKLRFNCESIPALDAEILSVFCYFCTNGLCFELGFELNTGKGGLHLFAEPTIGKVELSCQNDCPNSEPFEATWNPETQEWSKALPI